MSSQKTTSGSRPVTYRCFCPAYRAREGLGLLEIMVVLSVVGVVLAIAVPHFTKARLESKKKAAKAHLELIASAVTQLAWDTGEWPGGISRAVQQSAELWELGTAAAGLRSADSRFSNWQGPYIDKIPLDPWGKPYFFDPDYRIKGVDRVVVGSFGPNKVGPNLYDSDDIYVIVK